MNVGDILKAKGDRVETIWPERTLADALARCDERGISSVVVTNHAGSPLGLVTDRDMLRAINGRGGDALRLPTSLIMQSPAPACRADDTVAQIMHRMTFDRIRHLVVLDGEHLIGIVSIGDLLKSRLQDADLESRVLRERALSRIATE